MAVTKIIPIRATINKSIEYICNPSKTENCVFVHSENCFPQTAAVEFEFYLRQARAGGNTIGRHLIQSFLPDETTPEQAHEIGKKLAEQILGGQYAYVMATHVDKNHIHNHFVWCAVNIETHTKYHSNKRSYHDIQATSDRLCEENSLSVITEKSGRSGKGYYEYQAQKQGTSWKEKLRVAIDNCIASSSTFDEFIQLIKSAGYEVKHGKHISFLAPGQQRVTRSKSIGDDYTEERIKARISEAVKARKAVVQKPQAPTKPAPAKVTPAKPQPPAEKPSILAMLDLNKKKIRESAGLTNWAKKQNLKIAAKTLAFMQENGMPTFEEFDRRYADCNARYDKAEAALQLTEKQITGSTQMQAHLRNYGKTKDIYARFKVAGNKDKFLRDNPDTESAVMLHEAAKQYFDGYKKHTGQPLPSSKDVSARLAELRAIQAEQKKAFDAVIAEQQVLIRLQANLKAMLGRDNPKSRSTDVEL